MLVQVQQGTQVCRSMAGRYTDNVVTKVRFFPGLHRRDIHIVVLWLASNQFTEVRVLHVAQMVLSLFNFGWVLVRGSHYGSMA